MTGEMIQMSTDKLSVLLKRERAALLAGDFVALEGLLAEKEDLITALKPNGDVAPSALKHLGEQIRRNQLLLDSALDGIREVSDRMLALQKARSGLATYGSDGVKHDIQVRTDHSVERLA